MASFSNSLLTSEGHTSNFASFLNSFFIEIVKTKQPILET